MVRRLEGLQRRLAHREVTRGGVPPGLLFGFAQEIEEFCHTLVLLGFTALHYPEAGAADDGIALGIAGHAGQFTRPPFEFGRLRERSHQRRRGEPDGRLPVDDGLIALARPARVGVDPLFLPAGEEGQQFHAERAVDLELRSHALEAVVLIGEGLVVPGVRILDERPGGPGRGEADLGGAGGNAGLGGLFDLFVGVGRLCRIKAGLLEDGPVVVEDRRGGVERHRVEVPVLRIVGEDDAEKIRPVDPDSLILHELIDGIDRPGGEHRLGPDLKNLD